MGIFETLIQNLQSIGFFDYFLPYIFMLAVTYGVLSKIEVFDDNQVDATVSIVVSFMTILGIYQFVGATFFPKFFGMLAIFVVIILGLAILAGMFGVDISEVTNNSATSKKATLGVAAAILAVALILVFIFFPIGEVAGVGGFWMSEEFLTLVMIIGIIASIYFITRES
ncbi:MAG: hypothetical protein MUP58_02495 [Candidatus Nanohaloarchaeota archaeon QJJ-9]|nr:hypothetical protein [Candidatus Nanohaloarchaeota archaeon QJJ-9]